LFHFIYIKDGGSSFVSFDMPINQVLRYAYNTFSSADAVLYLWIGASFAAFTLGKILGVVR